MDIHNIIMTIVQILIGLGIIVGAIVFILKWCNGVGLRISKVESRMDALEIKMNHLEEKISELPSKIEGGIVKQFLPFASSVISMQNNPLPPEDIADMKRLMKKLQAGTISNDESLILKRYLEIEKEEAEEKNNSNMILATGIALAAIGLLYVLSDKKAE